MAGTIDTQAQAGYYSLVGIPTLELFDPGGEISPAKKGLPYLVRLKLGE
jgi:hypothetical protein